MSIIPAWFIANLDDAGLKELSFYSFIVFFPASIIFMMWVILANESIGYFYLSCIFIIVSLLIGLFSLMIKTKK
jgi:hypothetical protein